ncbi:hypothetical protein [Candidatus Nanohalovita haloferacivicina]|uniref:hypothetical protein n=1 Tax=Candidatus Nanohalovita haloferacivicina TaxID=2978046 RepID=UPI00325FC8ED|nr:hypothetical protein HBNXNv_0012 [Candidatus Nanohalobia archaeon BNXNv]
MTRPQDEYDKLVHGTLLRGVDERGEYTQAAFREDGVFVDVIRRPRGYEVTFETDKGLKDVYQGVAENYTPEGVVEVLNAEGDTYALDPDAWSGGNYEDFVEAYIHFPEFSVEWIDPGEEIEKNSLVEVFSNTIHFDIEEPVPEPGWKVGEAVTDADESLFGEVGHFLRNG